MSHLLTKLTSPLFRYGLFIICTLVSCATYAETPQKKLSVIASFSIAGDLIQQIGGDKIHLVTLVGANSDGHLYQPSAQDSKRLAEADIVFVNGLGFEGWIDRLIAASGFNGKLVYLSSEIKPLYWDATPDPHAWQSIDNVQSYVDIIRQTLAQQDSQHQDFYQQRATQYQTELIMLKQELSQFCASLSDHQRRLVTSHDAFSYFGRDCGVQFLAPQGLSTDDEPGAKDIAVLIEQIKSKKIPAVFIENMTNPKLIEQIQRETGVIFGGKLYSDALSEKSGPANSYLQMMRYNLLMIKTALIQAKKREVE